MDRFNVRPYLERVERGLSIALAENLRSPDGELQEWDRRDYHLCVLAS